MTATPTPGPACPGCGGRPDHHKLFCSACLVQIPTVARNTVARTWSAYRARPGSKACLAAYEDAVSAAASHVDAPRARGR